MRRRLRLPSPSMVVASLALVVALGGTSYAAVTITSRDVKNNSLTGTDIRNSSVTSSDVKNNSLTGSDIKNRSITKSDLKLGTLTKGANGSNGAKGDTGPAGPKGDKGDPATARPNRWLLINSAGAIEKQSGGFTITAAYPDTPAAANGNVYIDAGEDLSDNGIVATIALTNQQDQGGDPAVNNGSIMTADSNPEFSGEISVSQCLQAGITGCAPAGTNNLNHFVVSPRFSDGQRTTAGSRKRFYVQITG